MVIGSGLAGSLISNELAGRSHVVVLEIGPRGSVRFPSVHFLRKKLAEVSTFCFGEGGTTNLWHNGLIPLRPEDLTDAPFHQVLMDAAPFMDRAASALFFQGAAYSLEHTAAVHRLNRLGEKLGFGEARMDCLVYPKRFKPLSLDSRVEAHFEVSKLGFSVEEGRVTSVNFTQGDRATAVQADAVVVSAGTMGTPGVLQQLYASAGETTPPSASGFIDHPMGFVGKVRIKRDFSSAFRRLASFDGGTFTGQGVLRIRSKRLGLTCGVFFRPALTMENRLDLYKFKSLLGASAGRRRLRNALSPKLLHPDILAEVVAHLFGFNLPSRTYGILLVAEQRQRGHEVYANGDDLVVDWSVRDVELSEYQGVLSMLADTLAEISEELVLVDELTEDWLWSCAHHSGTTPMGTDGRGRVRGDLRLEGFRNVFVCDGSVIQEHSYANTGLTIAQLALQLAERIDA